jgi:hypothetical protein
MGGGGGGGGGGRKTVKSPNMWPMSLAAQVCKDHPAGIHILDRKRNFDLHDRTADNTDQAGQRLS